MVDRQRFPSNYDRLSRWYDLLSGPFESKWRDLAVRRLNVAADETVLEIGCGTGHALVRLAKAAGTASVVVGVDLSAGMCRVARARVARAGLTRVSILQGDAVALPFRPGAFAAVFMSFTLELFNYEIARQVLAECHRVLVASGRLGVVALDRREHATIVTRLYDWAGRRFPEWIDCHPIPVADTLSQHGFEPTETIRGSVGGLPVAVVIARKTIARKTGEGTRPGRWTSNSVTTPGSRRSSTKDDNRFNQYLDKVQC